jgi:hypothetical protein
MQWASRHCISLLAVHQNGEVVQWAKWMMKSAPRYCHSQRFAFQFLPGCCIVHTCVSHFKKLSFAASSVYKCLKSFIQPFLGWTSIGMQRKCVNIADNCYICGELTFSSQKHAITPIIRKAYHLYFGCQIGTRTRAGPRTYAAILVQRTFESGWAAKGNQCLLPYPWSGESRRIVSVTVTSAWYIPSGKGFGRRKSGPYAIRIYLLCG